MSLNVREYLKQHILVFDGAMGTLLTRRLARPDAAPLYARDSIISVESANLTAPDQVIKIHQEYLRAGANAIKTNTFALNPINCPDESQLAAMAEAGMKLAKEAAGDTAAVFADIGPISGATSEETIQAIHRMVKLYLDLGAENFLFETQSDAFGLEEACNTIHEKHPDAFILVSFAVMPDGYSRDGLFIRSLSAAVPHADAVGLNCVASPSHMQPLLPLLHAEGRPIAVMPNAGYPGVSGSFTVYTNHPAFFAEKVAEMATKGAHIVGGCCGTTPEDIHALCSAVSAVSPVNASPVSPVTIESPDIKSHSPLLKKLAKGKKVILAELDPPKDADLAPFMRGAEELKRAGIDVLTIADCPIARARADSSLLACKVMRELELDVMPHMTCRDRNLNATKALVLGLYGEGIRNILTVTGDPIPTAERDEVKSVYQFNSRKLARFLHALSENELPSPLSLFGALNVNALHFETQLNLAREKMASGICGFLTQPILTQQGFENLQRAREELQGAYLFGGIIPVVSERNARFMDAEIRGINVDPAVTERYHGLDRAQGEDLGITISVEIARRIYPYVDGYYLITPFQRTGMIARIVRRIQAF